MSQSIAALNNEAVALLQNDSCDAAIRTLKLAANRFASSPDASPTAPSSDTQVSTAMTDDGDDSPPVLSVAISIRCQQSNQNTASCQFLFQRALLVSENETSRSLMSSVSFFNLALIHHLMGIQDTTTRSCRKKLVMAKKLYILALDLVKTHCEAFGNKKALLLLLAIANNLGEINLLSYDAMGGPDEAKKCFALLLETLRNLDPLRDTDVYSQNGDSVFSFFYLNALVRGTGDIIVATAA